MRSSRALAVLLSLACLPLFPISLAAQESPPVLYFSRITQDFDGLPPIGRRFQIKGPVDPGILAVGVESFGFRGVPPRGLTSPAGTSAFCEALEVARTRAGRDAVHAKVAWERTDPPGGVPASHFTVNHPRLYYGREYVFLFAYFEALSEAQQRNVASKILTSALEDIVETAVAREGLLSGEAEQILNRVRPRLERAMRGAGAAACPTTVIDRRTKLPASLFDLFDEDELFRAIQGRFDELRWESEERRARGLLDGVLPAVLERLRSYRATADSLAGAVAADSLTDDDLKEAARLAAKLEAVIGPDSSTDIRFHAFADALRRANSEAEQERTQGRAAIPQLAGDLAALTQRLARLEDLERHVQTEAWADAVSVAGDLWTLFREETDAARELDRVREAAGGLSVVTTARQQAGTPPGLAPVVAGVVSGLDLPEVSELLIATHVQPYLETMRERHPFLISLDGGLVYVDRFEEVVPEVAVNIKLNRVDFDDPLDRTTEVSLLVGLGMTAPDDLDPDYKGIFGRTGDRSLLLGIGLRSPRISPLLRFHGGVALYRQEAANPLEDDFDTKTSAYVGISMNWDALDFAAGLFRDRATFNLGGG